MFRSILRFSSTAKQQMATGDTLFHPTRADGRAFVHQLLLQMGPSHQGPCWQSPFQLANP